MNDNAHPAAKALACIAVIGIFALLILWGAM
jgi:hypothetical protein